jgi:SPP1 gp7 family putative phage head morphogenesis protein
MSVNEELRDRTIRHAIALRRYEAGLTEKIIQLLNSADAALVEKIAGRIASIEERGQVLSARVTQQLERILAEVRTINSAAYARMMDTLSDELIGLSAVEADFQATALRAAIPVTISIGVPSPARLKTIVETSPIGGSILSKWVEGMSTDRLNRMEQEIRKGLVIGSNTDEITRKITGTKKQNYRDGIFEGSRTKARTLVRTAITHTTNVAASETWKANSDVVKKWQFVSTLDSRTSIICGSKDGETYDLDDLQFKPPLHPNCRSITIPVTKSYKELGFKANELTDRQRASMDGMVSSTTSFSQWLKSRDETTQVKVLGAARAQLFRSGKLDLNQFLSSDGTVLNLEQLSKLNRSTD